MNKLNLIKNILFGVIILSIINCPNKLFGQTSVKSEYSFLKSDTVLDTIKISSLKQLRQVAVKSNQVVIMEPGEYVAKGTMPKDPKTIFHFSGFNNTFIFSGVKIIVPTKVLRNMGPGNTHEFATYRIDGINITFKEGTFENTGWERPYKSIAEFEVHGNNISFLGCSFKIQGSQPYGYGDYYGKGSEHFVGLYKHSAMSILGDDVLVDGCDFKVYAFGHGIHIHGGQHTIIRNNTMEGALRPTNEIYQETKETHPNSPAISFDYKIWFPKEKRGQSIPKNEMLSLTEDGIRAYLNGKDRNGIMRRTGKITIENNYVDKMRNGVAMAIASDVVTATGNTVVNCDNAYSFSSNDVVYNNKGNTAFGPLLTMQYDHKKDSNIELELIDAEVSMGTHDFAKIIGSGHTITFTYKGDKHNQNLRPISIGVANQQSNSNKKKKQKKASNITLNNYTYNLVKLGKNSSNSTVITKSKVEDLGTNNHVKQIK